MSIFLSSSFLGVVGESWQLLVKSRLLFFNLLCFCFGILSLVFNFNGFWCLQTSFLYENFFNGMPLTFLLYPLNICLLYIYISYVCSCEFQMLCDAVWFICFWCCVVFCLCVVVVFFVDFLVCFVALYNLCCVVFVWFNRCSFLINATAFRIICCVYSISLSLVYDMWMKYYL